METTEAVSLARGLMNDHGLGRWGLQIDKAKSRGGLCNHYSTLISISSYHIMLNSVELVKLTILHEIAHALVGSGHNHDNIFKAKLISIGGNGLRCHNGAIAPHKYQTYCPECDYLGRKMFRRPKRGLYYRHRICGTRLEIREIQQDVLARE